MKILVPKQIAKDALKWSQQLGAPVIPCQGKQPKVNNWPQLQIEETRKKEFLEQFNKPGTNIGVVLGENANGLCTIDCDSNNFLTEFLNLNPRLDRTLLTWGARGANIWLRNRSPQKHQPS